VHFYNLGFLLYMFLRDWKLTWIIGASIVEILERLIRDTSVTIAPRHWISHWWRETAFNAIVVDPLCVIMGIGVALVTTHVFDMPRVGSHDFNGVSLGQLAVLMISMAPVGLVWAFPWLPLLHIMLLFIVLGIWALYPIDKLLIWVAIFAGTWLVTALPLPPPLQEAFWNIVIATLALLLVFTAILLLLGGGGGAATTL
jgi:hypothetical protein